jgi:predicted DNA-binding transcriptional regulator YafY
MFTGDEAEAIAVVVRMLARTGDPGLQKAAESVLSKVTLVVPDLLCEYLRAYVSKSVCSAAPRCRRGASCRP